MRVEVEITTDARLELLALVSTRSPNAGDAVRFAALYSEDMRLQLQMHEGMPPGAEAKRGTDGNVWWWHYADGIWTAYTRAIKARRLFRPASLFIQIISFRALPPVL